MLNKIKIVGEVFLPIKTKIKIINKTREDGIEEEEKHIITYFSLRVLMPNGSLSILRCFAQREIAESLEREVAPGDVLEVAGYLRNERNSRQILIIVVKFTKLDIPVSQISLETNNQVQLIGRIITEVQEYSEDKLASPSPTLYFKLSVPREKSELPLYFCRVKGDFITNFRQQLKKNEVIFLEGYLQTVKVPSKTGAFLEGDSRISLITCRAFTRLWDDSADELTSPEQFKKAVRVVQVEPVEKIDFSKDPPKKKVRIEE